MKRIRFLAALLPLTTSTLAVTAPQPTVTQSAVTTNFKDADITMVAEAVGAATGKNFIIDPRVRAQVTMLTSKPLSPAAFYEAFLSMLEVHGFTAEPAGEVIKIVPDNNAKQHPGLDLPDHVPSTDEFVTEVIDVRNVSATQLVPVLRPLVPTYGHLAAYPASNILIISDRAANVQRMIRLVRKIDVVGDQDVEMMQLQNASATEVVRVVNTLYQNAAAQGAEPSQTKLAADDRSNSVLISGDQAHRLKLRALVANLDTPLKASGNTKVRYLRYADATKLAPKLKEEITGMAQQTAGGGGGGAGGAAAPSAVANAEKNSTIWADETTNSLVVTAPPKIMEAVMSIVDKLDIRRAQVSVEAIIAEMQSDRSGALGINWATFSKDGSSNIPIGAFVSPIGTATAGGASIIDLASAIASGNPPSTQMLQGGTFGVGKLANSGLSFAAVLRALRTDTSTNIISTPSATTLDNQEAEMKSGQEIPFISGQYTATAGAPNTIGQVNPFTTVNREDVGISLKVTPTIGAEGNTVQLKITIEDSSLGTKPAGLSDYTTNKRQVTTTVRIQDGGVVVIGGLTQDQMTKEEDSVPFISKIPVVGLLFKTRSSDHQKNDLMVFIKPHIIRDDSDTAYETESKYRYMLDEEKRGTVHDNDIVPVLPFEKDPRLPKLPPAPPPSSNEQAPVSVEEKERAAREEAQRAHDAAQQGPGGLTAAPAPQGPANNGAPSQVPPLPPAPPR